MTSLTGHLWQSPALHGLGRYVDDLLGRPVTTGLQVEPIHHRVQSAADEALRLLRVVKKPNLQRHDTLGAQVNPLGVRGQRSILWGSEVNHLGDQRPEVSALIDRGRQCYMPIRPNVLLWT